MNGKIVFGIVKDLKPGRFVVIDNEPCKVIGMDVSKTGKHGSAKARVDAVSLFTGSRKTLIKPGDASIEIPIIEKKAVQIIAIMGNRIQLMDLQTYEMSEIDVPEEFREKIRPGIEAEIQEVMGKKMLTRIKD